MNVRRFFTHPLSVAARAGSSRVPVATPPLRNRWSVSHCSGLAAALFAASLCLAHAGAFHSQPLWERDDYIGKNETRIFIFKSRRMLELYKNGRRLGQYRVSLGLAPVGPKRVVGDRKTPEGDYFICSKNTTSRFHRFLGLSYPSAVDAQCAFERGAISLDTRDSIIDNLKTQGMPRWDTELGGWVGIHGYPSDEYLRLWVTLLYPKPDNWTDGCIAMWNCEIEELFANVEVGTPVSILP